jgi:proteasome assembly chaperone (PAC2) family protein
MSKRKTFSDLVKGDNVEVRKDPNVKGVKKIVLSISKHIKYGVKVDLGDDFGFVIDPKSASVSTEFFDRRSSVTYIVDQSVKAAKDSE